ncbi:MAG: DNA alkylation repair protein [Aggregatilineales bacterium]
MEGDRIPFKAYYGYSLAESMAAQISAVYPAFPSARFLAAIRAAIELLELKDRVAFLAAQLRACLPADYEAAVEILVATLGPELPDDGGMFSEGYHVLPIAQFVEDYGLNSFERSMDALYEITKRNTAEFAIRPYLLRYPDATLERLHGWAEDSNPHVRRLISEGMRTRLPWAKRLDLFIADPEPVIELLEKLKADSSLYVCRSVANNCNDLSKDHPERILVLMEAWRQAQGPHTAFIVRHGLRTLTKAADPRALALVGYAMTDAFSLEALSLEPTVVGFNEPAQLAITLRNSSDIAIDALIDYRIHFVRSRGEVTPKVFQWKKVRLAAGETTALTKTISFKPVSVRRYYAGSHQIDVRTNGQVLASAHLDLVMD